MKYLLLVPLAIVLATLIFITFLELDGSGIAVLVAGAFFALSMKLMVAIDRLFKSKQNK